MQSFETVFGIILGWAAIETAFWAFLRHRCGYFGALWRFIAGRDPKPDSLPPFAPHRRWAATTRLPPVPPLPALQLALDDFLSLADLPLDLRAYLRGWFPGADGGEAEGEAPVSRQDFLRLAAREFCERGPGQGLTPGHARALELFADAVEERWGVRCGGGRPGRRRRRGPATPGRRRKPSSPCFALPGGRVGGWAGWRRGHGPCTHPLLNHQKPTKCRLAGMGPWR